MEGYTDILGSEVAAHEEVDRIMSQADTDNSGFIDYTEWLVATMNKATLLSKENLEATFNAFDKDGSGNITTDELKGMLDGVGATDEVWD
jgi:calcium-dependent protein kinase